MTIAYVLKMYPRFSETFILNEILELERQGVDLRIYSLRKPDDGRFHPNLARVRAPVTYLPEYIVTETRRVLEGQRVIARHNPAQYRKVLWYTVTRRNRAAFKRFLQAGVLAAHFLENPVSHMHAHFASSATRVAMFVSLLTGTSYSFTAHAKDIFLHSLDMELLRDMMRLARFVVPVSEFNRKYLATVTRVEGKTGLRGLVPDDQLTIQPDRLRRVYNGIDLSQFNPDDGYIPHASREPLIVGVGRLVEKKGFDVLIRACAELQQRGTDFRCELVGKGPQEQALERLIQDLRLESRVTLVGPKPQDRVIEEYRRAALFALPCIVASDGNRDGLPTVLLEAMAMRLPVVSTDLTGVPEIIENGVSGFVVAQNDPKALADALSRLLASPGLREKLGVNARARIKRTFDLGQNVRSLHRWLLEEGHTENAGQRAVLGNRNDERTVVVS